MPRRALAVTSIVFVCGLFGAAAAQAGWHPPQPVSPASRDVAMLGVAVAPADRPAVLLGARVRGGYALQLRATARTGGPLGRPITIARSANSFEGAGLAAGADGDLVAAWLEIVNGSRRPVVATGPRLADRQVLAPGPRSTQILELAANRRGDAVVTFWRYRGSGYQVFGAYRKAGGRFGAPQVLATGTPDFPTASIGQDGAAAVAWTDRDGVRVAERPAGASAFSAAVTLPGSEGVGGDASVALDDGGAVATWALGRGGADGGSIVAALRAPGSATWSTPQTLSADGVRIPRGASPRAMLDGDHAVVAWIDGVQGTVVHDRAEIAARDGFDGAWSAPVRRTVKAPAHAASVDLLGPAPGRLAQLLVTTSRGGTRALLTATVRDDGTLGPSRPIPLGAGYELGRPPFAAQGTRHVWLGLDRWHRGAMRNQSVLVRSEG